jgi:hypothetical protein
MQSGSGSTDIPIDNATLGAFQQCRLTADDLLKEWMVRDVSVQQETEDLLQLFAMS